MPEDRIESEQERVWGLLYDLIQGALQQFGQEEFRGRADYFLVDDNYGFKRHAVEVHKLHMLGAHIVKALRSLLVAFPDWEIIIVVDIPGKENVWPPMGLTLRAHEVIDGLQRQYLPQEFQSLTYEGSRPGTGYD